MEPAGAAPLHGGPAVTGPTAAGGVAPGRYVAIGDSFTEGMCDPAPSGSGSFRGWADRLAERLDGVRRDGGEAPLEYANLAVRGRLLARVLDEQLPVALASGADLVSLVAGGNDVLRPGVDVDAVARRLDGAVAALRAGGAQVLLATGADPRDSPLVRLTRGRAATYNAHIWSIANRHGARVADLWGMHALQDWRMWAPDRIHLSAEGHRRVADLAAVALGLAPLDVDYAEPLPPAPRRSRHEGLREDAAWARAYVLPWVRRRLSGRSSGDGREPKRPVPVPVDAPVDVPGGPGSPSGQR